MPPSYQATRPALAGASRQWRLKPSDVVIAVGLNALLIVGMWVRHGGLGLLGSWSANLTAAGQLAALLGTYGALLQVILMSRNPWLEQLFGLDRLTHWHRWLGFSTISVICAHVFLTTFGYALADGSTFMSELWKLLALYPYMLMAGVATLLLVLIAATSIRKSRRRLKYETWHYIHFYTYLAIILAFGHEIAVGTDLTTDPVARGYWIALYIVVALFVLVFRFGNTVQLARRHQLRVAHVVPEGRDIASVYITGKRLDEMQVRAGQFFKWRFFTSGGWWKAHPFSLSAAPNKDYLRITVKKVGDGSEDVHLLKPGVTVWAEGPYGLFTTGEQHRGTRYLFIAGGIGITPIRAMLEEIAPGNASVVLIYRASDWADVVFKQELEDLINERRGTLFFVVGRRGAPELPEDPLSPRALRRMVSDLDLREIYICGPAGMMENINHNLESIKIPKSQIHFERFALLK